MFCVKCGQKLPEESRFCTSCGAEINNEATPNINYSSQMQAEIQKYGQTNTVSPTETDSKYAIWSVIIPTVMLVWWFFGSIPIIIAIFGLAFSFTGAKKALNTSKRSLAKAGMILTTVTATVMFGLYIINLIMVII